MAGTEPEKIVEWPQAVTVGVYGIWVFSQVNPWLSILLKPPFGKYLS